MKSSESAKLQTVLGGNLACARQSIGLTKELLAARVGISASQLEGLENGDLWPDSLTLAALADALGWPASRLLEKKTPPPAEDAEREILSLSAEIGPAATLRILRHRAAREPIPEVKSFVADLEGEIAELHREIRCLAAINRDLLLRLNQEKTSP